MHKGGTRELVQKGKGQVTGSLGSRIVGLLLGKGWGGGPCHGVRRRLVLAAELWHVSLAG